MERTKRLILGIAAALLSLPAWAQSSPDAGTVGMDGMGPAPRPAADCSTARSPERCEARLNAMEACKDQIGKARRACIEDRLPPPDCSKKANPQRCEALQKARETCKGKVGAERRTCMGEQAPKKKKQAKKRRASAKR